LLVVTPYLFVFVDVRLDGGARIVMNATLTLAVYMELATDPGNVVVNQDGEACSAIKVR
jgi:hypothetical protein